MEAGTRRTFMLHSYAHLPQCAASEFRGLRLRTEELLEFFNLIVLLLVLIDASARWTLTTKVDSLETFTSESRSIYIKQRPMLICTQRSS